VANLSLNELKEQNAETETKTEDNQNVVEQEVLDDENINEEVAEKADDSQEDDTEDGSTEGGELESWQLTEDETSENDQTGFVPNAEAAKKRKQNKVLRGTVKEQDSKIESQDSEIELLRKQVEKLKAGITSNIAPIAPTLSPRPTREDFGYDEVKYDNALDKWNDDKVEMRINNLNQSSIKKQQEEEAQLKSQQAQKNSLDDHYARAEKLIDSGKVSADNYNAADVNVRRALETVFPNAGDQMADRIIATLNSLGDGSEKVMYQLGVNNSKLNEFINTVKADPTGLSMMAHLGKLHSDISNPAKRRSNAPKPATRVSGDSQTKNGHGSMFKQWSKSTDVQSRISLKRKAKAAGEDVSKW
jgi:hypothetical protein